MIKYNHNKSKNSKTKAAESRTPGILELQMKRGIRYVDGETLPGDPADPGGAGNGVGAGSDGNLDASEGNDPAGI